MLPFCYGDMNYQSNSVIDTRSLRECGQTARRCVGTGAQTRSIDIVLYLGSVTPFSYCQPQDTCYIHEQIKGKKCTLLLFAI